jgi:Tfp pilus assembly pilus retraction ATPase PilT
LLNEFNETKSIHIVTLEDPVEFVHPQKKATFNQREMGNDFSSFASGLRAALRQAPKVVLVGEMRDRETVEIGMSAAETGHLVMSTLHTINAGQTINRIVGMFDQTEAEQIRIRLAETVRWVVSQRLLPRSAAPHRRAGNHGQQLAREGRDRARRIGRQNVLRNHRSRWVIWMEGSIWPSWNCTSKAW